jgi:hypothetical protein
MPYRHAHWYILSLFPLIGLAFWPSYWSVLSSASWQFHVHGVSAFGWLLLLAAQSWTIHQGERAAHRTTGLLSLFLFPLFLAGGVGLFFGMAEKMLAGSEFHVLYAARLAWLDFASVAMMAFFYHEALRHRRKVRLHSAYMLATTIALLPPILGRLSGIPLGVTGPDTFDRLYPGFVAAQFLTAGIALAVARGRGAEGRPWVLAALVSALGGMAFVTIGGTRAWQDLFAIVGTLPAEPFMLAVGLVGALIAWSGWTQGKRPAAFDGALPA